MPKALDRYDETRFSLLQCTPVTGRKHQIRRHLKHIAHPIIGDSRHGKGPLNRACAAYFGLGRLWLHCQQIQLVKQDGSALSLQANIDEDFETLLNQLSAYKV